MTALTLDNGHDGALLDGGGALETIGVDSAQELGLEVHVVERVGRFIVVRLDLACGVVRRQSKFKPSQRQGGAANAVAARG
jgi:hypothetical protein